MNKRLLFFGCFISIIFSLSAQDWTQQNPNVELRRLYDISIHSSGNAWAVGFDGSILHSADFGQNWQAQAPAGPSDLLFVAAPEDGNAQQVMAIGDSTINYTNDGGANWTETNSGFQTGEFNGLAVPSTDAAYIITWDGEMLKSTDFGMSWDSLALPVNDEWRSISFINDSTGWIASALGFLLHTTDGGMNWTSLPTTQFSWQLFATFYDENIGYLADRRDLYRTDDGGQTWTLLQTELFGNYIYDMVLLGPDHIVVTRSVEIHESLDGGQTWLKHTPTPPSIGLRGISGLPTGEYWISGFYSTVLNTDDAGQSWTDQLPGRKNNLDCVRFYDQFVGLAGGGQGTLLKTTDSGISWQDISLTLDSGVNEFFKEVLPASQNEYWGATNLRMLHSQDGGQTWQEANLDGTNYSCIQASPNGNLFVTSQEPDTINFWRSTDGGQNWISTDISNQFGLLDLGIYGDSIIMASSFGGNIYRSEDGGQSWMDRSTGRLRAMGKVYCTSPDTAWATSFGAYDSIFQTTDGGLSWQGVLMPIREVWREMAWLNSQVGWVITGSGFDRGYVYHTTDGGQSWSLTQDAGIPLTSITAPLSDQELFWVTGSGGFIGQYDNSTLNLSLSPQDFNALSIYPNPSSGTVQIQPEQWQGQNGLMKLYDLQGNLLWQESWHSPRQQIDLAALPNALYLLHLQLGEQHYRQKLWLQR